MIDLVESNIMIIKNVLISVEIGSESHQEEHKSHKHEEKEGIESESLFACDASSKKTAVMVKVLNAHLAFITVAHVDFLTHANLTRPDIAFLVDRHVSFADDSRVHRDRKEI
jgi:ribosomal protein L25 (general stress protein Ctc)